MRRLYTLLLYLATPLVLIRLAQRGLRAPAYWRRWPERFGYVPIRNCGESLWLHAVSVGEAQAAAPLLQQLRARHPELPIVVSTTTPTGAQRVRQLFGDQVLHVYAPYDLPGAVGRFLRRVQPRLAVVMETELWPNLFHAARRLGVPLVLANGRLSERSFRGYRRVHALMAATLRCTSLVAVQTPTDAQRFVALGADARRVRVVGNLKFDVRPAASLIEQAEALRGHLGRNRSVWIAASTHEGEEVPVLDALVAVRERLPDCLLILVPRHPERFARVAALCRRRGLSVALHSRNEPVGPTTAVYLGDTMGDLPPLYAAADIAFVGGSLVAAGGHNPLEPAALGRPLVFGPHMDHVGSVRDLLLERRAGRQVGNAQELATTLLELLENPPVRTEAGERARLVVESNRGTLARLVELLSGYLENPARPAGASAPAPRDAAAQGSIPATNDSPAGRLRL